MSPFRGWVYENALALMKSKVGEDVRKHGLCIITQTYATPKCKMTAWNQRNGSVTIGIDVEATEGIKLGVDATFHEGKGVAAWRSYEAEVSSPEKKESWRKVRGLLWPL